MVVARISGARRMGWENYEMFEPLSYFMCTRNHYTDGKTKGLTTGPSPFLIDNVLVEYFARR